MALSGTLCVLCDCMQAHVYGHVAIALVSFLVWLCAQRVGLGLWSFVDIGVAF